MYSYLLVEKTNWDAANYAAHSFRFLTAPFQLHQYEIMKNNQVLIVFQHDSMLAIKQLTLELTCQSIKHQHATAETLPLLMKKIKP